jgi:S-adenosylmethionine hydrolase
VHALENERYRLPEVSRTFHARDVFAPAAAHLAAGIAIEELGPALDPATLIRIDVPDPALGKSQISATVLSVDRFGNVATNARREHIEGLGVANGDRVEVRIALDRYYAIVAETFADAAAGELILYEDSYGLVTLAISRGDAARLTGATGGDELRIVVL